MPTPKCRHPDVESAREGEAEIQAEVDQIAVLLGRSHDPGKERSVRSGPRPWGMPDHLVHDGIDGVVAMMRRGMPVLAGLASDRPVLSNSLVGK
jgi:hypothetical protein